MQDCDGIVIVQNGDLRLNDNDLHGLIVNFPMQMKILPGLCLGYLHHPSGSIDPVRHNGKRKNSHHFPKFLTFLDVKKFGLMLSHTSIEDGRSTILPTFDTFLSKIVVAKNNESEKQAEEAEEY